MAPVRRSNRKALLVAGIAALSVLALAGVYFGVLKQQPKPGSHVVAIPEKSIAVLPFENLSDEKQNAFFADGVQDEILTDLAKVADLKVISRTSVMQYKTGAKRNLREIANALGVAHVVEGSVQRAANRVRVSAQLIDAKTDSHLWAEHYDRPLGDVFAIQSEIAKRSLISFRLNCHQGKKPSSSNRRQPILLRTTPMFVQRLYLR
jgi:TolB-like protein